MEYIDTHCHISDAAFEGCEEDVIARAQEAGVTIMLQPDVDSSERERMFSLASRFKGVLFPMLGLYPGSVGADWKDEIDAMMAFRDKGIVAIGEIGLDYHYGKDSAKEQREAFRTQLELAAEWNLPVNIHLREATEDFLSILSDCRHLNLRGCLHAFSGSPEFFERVCSFGEWYAGIGGVLTFKKASLAEAVTRIPLERMLLETDSPYLTPVPHRGERNESSYIPIIADFLACRLGRSAAEVAAVTTGNAKKLFGL